MQRWFLGFLLCLVAASPAHADDAAKDKRADLQDVLAGFHAHDAATRMDAYAKLEVVLVDDPKVGPRCLPRVRDVLRRRGPKERARVMTLLALVSDAAALETWLARFEPEEEPDPRVRHAAVDAARLRVDDQAVARALVRVIRTPTTSVPARALAIEALGHLGDAAPLAVLTQGAPKEPWVVAAGRALALGHRTDDASLGPLVALMEHADLGVRLPAWEGLMRRTAQDLPPDAKAWRTWFEAYCARKKEKAKPEASPDGETRYAPAKHVHVPTYYGIPIRRPHSHVVFCLDVSQSMYGDGIGHARKHLRKTLRDLPSTHHFELVAFNENVMPWAGRLVRAHPVEKYLAIQWLDKLETLTYTNIYDAVETAFQYMGRGRKPADEPVTLDAVFLLSDGAPNRGRHRTDDRVVKHIGLLSQRDVPVHTIGAGEKVFDLLRRIAKETGGRFVDAFE